MTARIDLPLAYCMNVHGGRCFEDLMQNLEIFAAPIRQQSCQPEELMGVGLWLSQAVLEDILVDWAKVGLLKNKIKTLGLVAYTLNGFPQGDFHQAVVKQKVYQPAWHQSQRLNYTKGLVRVLVALLEPGQSGSISTLPLGWQAHISPAQATRCAENLLEMARYLKEVHAVTGRCIYLAIEPEPGCYLDTCQDVITFYEQHLFKHEDPEMVSQYLRVCHDVCHASVMFESQKKVLDRYDAAGIRVGKIQLSNAIDVDFRNMNRDQKQKAISQLKAFSEDRYMHQCGVIDHLGDFKLVDDLPLLLNNQSLCDQACRIRVHFHVPVFVEKLTPLATTRHELEACLRIIQSKQQCGWEGHLEIETYAWHVLPKGMVQEDLIAGIAKEMRWVKDFLI